jgi:phosphatidylinositol alpha-1,6-mannosyltransferase
VTDALMVTSSFLPGRGGIESYLAELCEELAPRVAVMAAGRREGSPLPADLPYPTIPFPGRLIVPGPRATRAVVDNARRLGVGRVIFGTPWPLLLMAPKLRSAGLSYAVIVHGAELLVPAAIPIVRSRLANALDEADVVLGVSEFTARKVQELLASEGYDARDVPVLRARVDVERFRPDVDAHAVRERLGIESDARIVLCFGRLVRRKGVHRLIRAMPTIRAAVGEVALIVAGTGPDLARLRRLARRLDARVVFAGRVADEDAPAYYAAADVFALPVVDRYGGLEVEGLGVVLLEAAAAGLPSVTGRSGGTPEAVLHERTGLVIDASDPKELSDAIIRLLRDEGLARAMGEEGRAYVGKTFARGSIPEELSRWLGKGRSI